MGIAIILDREITLNSSDLAYKHRDAPDPSRLRYKKKTGTKARRYERELKRCKLDYTHKRLPLCVVALQYPDCLAAYNDLFRTHNIRNVHAADELVHVFTF